jgi:hypothetical protein
MTNIICLNYKIVCLRVKLCLVVPGCVWELSRLSVVFQNKKLTRLPK